MRFAYLASLTAAVTVLVLLLIAPPVGNGVNSAFCSGAVVSLTFDDGYRSVHRDAFPLLQQHGMAATTYVMPGLVGGTFEGKPLMNWEELDTLQRNRWEIGSHTLTHVNLSLLNASRQHTQFNKSRHMLRERGFPAATVAMPYGAADNETRYRAAAYYRGVRTSTWGSNNLSHIDRTRIRAVWMVNDTAWPQFKQVLDTQVRNGAWTVIMFHHITNETERHRYSTTPRLLEHTLTYLQQQDVQVSPVNTVLQRCGEEL